MRISVELDKDSLRRFVGKTIRVVTNSRSYTGTLLVFDSNELTLRTRLNSGVFVYVTIPARKINAILTPILRRRRRRRRNNC